MAAVVRAEYGAVVTGLTALEFAEAGPVVFDRALHLLVGRGFGGPRLPGVRYERTRRLPEPLPLRVPPTAPYARAVVDACRRLAHDADARCVVLESVRSRLCDPAALTAECAHAPARERARLGPFVAEARSRVRSLPEADLRGAVLSSDLPEPLWNPEVSGRDGRLLCRPDGLWPAEGLAVEVDSVTYHSAPRDRARTAARRGRMEAAGLTVLSVLPRDIAREPGHVLDLVREALHRARDTTAGGARTLHRELLVQNTLW